MTDSPRDTGHLRSLAEADLDLVLEWRNHPDVRRFMYTRHEIAVAEHRRWFEQSRQQPGRHLLVYEEAGLPRGFVNLGPTRFAGIADWGFYAATDAPRGTGRRLGRAAMNHAFSTLGLHKVCGEALAGNEPSRRLHEALGFREEGVLREHYFDGTHYLSVVCFGLLGREWTGTA